ncbi:MAG: hypothetical protein HC905_19530 [Bacteroidales bacterium]|nr:hypothetical protein [Bacteroidales bacterium]
MKKILILSAFITMAGIAYSQDKTLYLSKATSNNLSVTNNSVNIDIVDVKTSVAYFNSNLKSTQSGEFIELESEGLVRTFDLGKPNIPVFSKLIELPIGATVQFNIVSYDEEFVDLTANGISQK